MKESTIGFKGYHTLMLQHKLRLPSLLNLIRSRIIVRRWYGRLDEALISA